MLVINKAVSAAIIVKRTAPGYRSDLRPKRRSVHTVRVALVTRANTSESTSSRCHGPSPVSRRCIGAALSALPLQSRTSTRNRHRRSTPAGISGPTEDGIGAGGDKDRRANATSPLGAVEHRGWHTFCPRRVRLMQRRRVFPRISSPCREGSRLPGHEMPWRTRSTGVLRPALVYRHLMAPAKTRGQAGTARNGAAPRTCSVVAATDVARRANDLNVARGCRHDLGEGWTRRLVRFAFGPQPVFNHSFRHLAPARALAFIWPGLNITVPGKTWGRRWPSRRRERSQHIVTGRHSGG